MGHNLYYQPGQEGDSFKAPKPRKKGGNNKPPKKGSGGGSSSMVALAILMLVVPVTAMLYVAGVVVHGAIS